MLFADLVFGVLTVKSVKHQKCCYFLLVVFQALKFYTQRERSITEPSERIVILSHPNLSTYKVQSVLYVEVNSTA